MFRFLTAPTLLFLLFLAGCEARGTLQLLEESSPSATQHEIFVATTREPVGNIYDYSGERGKEASYLKYTVSVPPSHKPGKIEWPENRPPDADEHFITSAAGKYDSAQSFISSVNERLRGLPEDEREATVFIHGYNTNFAEGLYRFTQMVHDFKISGAPVHFSWASAAVTEGYVYDRDSAYIARDALEELFEDLAKTEAKRILIVGHSMGGFLTVETLRQIWGKSQSNLKSKLEGIMLVSPDIDIDVFKAQIKHIQPLPQPFVIFASSKDKALRVSAFLTGQQARVGSLANATEFSKSGVTFIDVTDFEGGDSLNHATAITSPAMIALINSLPRNSTSIDLLARNHGP